MPVFPAKPQRLLPSWFSTSTLRRPGPWVEAIAPAQPVAPPGRSPLQRLWQRLPQLVILLALVLGMTGCMDYDSRLRFNSPSRGEWVQHVRLNARLGGRDATVPAIAKSLEQRVQSLGGKLQRLSPQEFQLTVPFTSSRELERKFNQFFQAGLGPELPDIQAQISLQRNNFILLERATLHYELDLSSLGVSGAAGNLLLAPSGLDLQFTLETPLGAEALPTAALQPTQPGARPLVWRLVPGQLNQIDAVFWLPNPIGLGSVAIAVLVAGGLALKSRQP